MVLKQLFIEKKLMFESLIYNLKETLKPTETKKFLNKP